MDQALDDVDESYGHEHEADLRPWSCEFGFSYLQCDLLGVKEIEVAISCLVPGGTATSYTLCPKGYCAWSHMVGGLLRVIDGV